MTSDLSDQVAIVTGGASGIGLATALRLGQCGATVAIADVDEARLESALKTVQETGTECLAVKVEVSCQESVEAMVKNVVRWGGKIDIFIHSAGVGIERTLLDTTLEEWRRVIDIDLTGTFLCGQAIARQMIKRKYGRIVNLASTAGIRGGTARAAYGAAKGGVITLTKVMAVELAPSGITVNALAPGAIETEMVRKMHSDTTRQVYTAAIPMDRYGTPEETAAAAVFLSSPAAGYITGHILAVDGGFLAAGVLHKN